jgi:hypothetical protein
MCIAKEKRLEIYSKIFQEKEGKKIVLENYPMKI